MTVNDSEGPMAGPVRFPMSRSAIAAAAVSAILALGVVCVEAAEPDQAATPDISPTFRDEFRAAQAAQKAQRWADVVAKAEKVLANSKRKPDDTYYAYYLLFDAHRALGNKAEELNSLRGLVDSGFLSSVQVVPYVNAVMALAFQAKQYDTAIEYGKRLIESGDADAQVYTTVGQSHFLRNDFAETARFFRSVVDGQMTKGEKPLEQNLVMLHSSYEKLGDQEGVTHSLELLVVNYPKPRYWDALLFPVRSDSGLEPREKLQVYRLMYATGTLRLASDYGRFAEYAQLAGSLEEARRVFEAGLNAKVFTADADLSRVERQMAAVGKAADAGRPELRKLEVEAGASATGEESVAVGMGYFSYDEADKAVAALQAGLAKGGLKPEVQVEASLVLGMAQLRANDRAGAATTFKSISTANPRLQRIAQLWALHAS